MADMIRWEPFRDIVSFRDAMDRWLEEGLGRPLGRWPFGEDGVRTLALDVYETDENLVVEAPLPGLNLEDVDIAIMGRTLTIEGENKTEEEKEEKGKYYCRESRFGAVHRTITLPVEVNADAAEAVFKDGMLTLTLPKVEEAKPKHIKIAGAK